ncbi:T9SS type A sorting domain-containing protein [Polaribacter vadi]|uniref:T9SS type A sorting domain-containing protein n=1 Tax=Polaribacter vadi TaxID=1774273 RepID=UPI0030EB4427|tara:strand:+ start:9855 stop:12017 length:2163 start_codon:yes stop_codon:yes gene_type:complete
MKKIYLFIMLMILASIGAYAQLGSTTFNTASDNASATNYPGATWSDGSNGGTGFGDWTLIQSATNAGRYIGGTAIGDPSFGLYSENSGNFSAAERSLNSDLKMGETISVNIGHTSTINGEVFLQLLDDGAVVFTLKFVGGTSDWQINDGGSDFAIAQPYAADTSLAFSFTYNEDGTYSYTFGAASGDNFTPNNTISGINSIKLQSTNQGGGQNFGFNNLNIESKYTIAENSTVASDADITVPYLDVQTGSTLNLGTTSGVTVSGDLNVSGFLNVSSGSSLIVNGTSTGNITYNRTLATDNWYLISSPVVGQDIDTFAAAEGLAVGSTPITNRGLGDYNNSTPGWEYYQVGATGTGNFISGDARAIKLATAGDIAFTGTMPDTNASIAINSNTNGFNLIGNPYTSYLALNINASAPDDLLERNSSSLTETTAWLFNQATGSYDEVNSASPAFYLAPGQGFFVSSNGNNTFLFGNAQKSHQNADSFQKTATTRPEINLVVNNGTVTRDTDIFYINGTTTGFDNGYDSSIFGGNFSENKLTVYTHEVTNGNGKKLGIQSLPNSDLETMVIPVGIIAEANKEITFSANVANLPAGLKVFLEDRNTNTFTRLDELNSKYKVTLTEAANEIGRFYLHTKSSALSTETFALKNVSIYNADKSTLRIVGLSQGKSTIKMFNVLGKQVLNATFNSNGVSEINVSQLSTGVYIVQLENEAGSLNKKIVLE